MLRTGLLVLYIARDGIDVKLLLPGGVLTQVRQSPQPSKASAGV